MSTVQVIIMCKAPVAGRVKTRLTPRYNAAQAMQIHQAMATTVIHRARELFDRVLVAADDPLHPFFSRFDLPVVAQKGGSLGDRMQRLLVQACMQRRDPVLFLGTDSPHMDSSRLQAAAEAIGEYDVVLGPVEDGGYDLIALNGPHTALFEGIAWGSDQVMQQTLRAAEAAGLSCLQLSSGFDIDTAADLERAGALWPMPRLP